MESENKNMLEKINERISQSVNFKLLCIGILILILLIPQSMINSLIIERENRMRTTVQEVTSKWSGSQTISGPFLVVPYKTYVKQEDEKEVKTIVKYATFLPDSLNLHSVIHPEERYRGIFKVVVYKAQLSITGNFPKPDFSKWDIAEADILWSRAMLNVGISDLRGIEKEVTLVSGGSTLPFLPGTSMQRLTQSGIHLPMEPLIENLHKDSFSIDISLKGSEKLYFVPFGKDTRLSMTSAWKDPSFDGAFLPKDRTIGPNGFKATWEVLHFNRNYPQSWTDQNYYINEFNSFNSLDSDWYNNQYSSNVDKLDLGRSKFGVNLLVTADHYQKSMRSSKYAILIIALSFLMFFLIEVTQKMRVHAFQYILVGLALMMFYTLLLSISEHLGFNQGYLISSIAVILLIAAYSTSVLSNRRLAYLTALSLAAIYGFLFIIIQIESYALLVGSIGLFVILALTMFFTRNIQWYRSMRR
jgi:inner membrane protein